jgi:diguanylate cyclase (GGDEF)-like protein
MKDVKEDSLFQENVELRAALVQMKTRLDELETLADTDTLTPLPNRRAFLRRLDSVILYAARHETPAAVLFIDLDGLKRINDTHGHLAGDIVLKKVAERLTQSLRATDMVARIGGDEFGLILDHLGEGDANAKALALTRLISSEPVDIGCVKLSISATVGVAAVRPNDRADTLLERADAAMYAKRLHRSQR